MLRGLPIRTLQSLITSPDFRLLPFTVIEYFNDLDNRFQTISNNSVTPLKSRQTRPVRYTMAWEGWPHLSQNDLSITNAHGSKRRRVSKVSPKWINFYHRHPQFLAASRSKIYGEALNSVFKLAEIGNYEKRWRVTSRRTMKSKVMERTGFSTGHFSMKVHFRTTLQQRKLDPLR